MHFISVEDYCTFQSGCRDSNVLPHGKFGRHRKTNCIHRGDCDKRPKSARAWPSLAAITQSGRSSTVCERWTQIAPEHLYETATVGPGCGVEGTTYFAAALIQTERKVVVVYSLPLVLCSNHALATRHTRALPQRAYDNFHLTTGVSRAALFLCLHLHACRS